MRTSRTALGARLVRFGSSSEVVELAVVYRSFQYSDAIPRGMAGPECYVASACFRKIYPSQESTRLCVIHTLQKLCVCRLPCHTHWSSTVLSSRFRGSLSSMTLSCNFSDQSINQILPLRGQLTTHRLRVTIVDAAAHPSRRCVAIEDVPRSPPPSLRSKFEEARRLKFLRGCIRVPDERSVAHPMCSAR